MRGFRPGWRPLLPVLVFGVVVLAGCGGGGGATTTAPPPPTSGQAHRGQGQLPAGDGQGGVRLQRIGEFDQPVYVAQPPGDDHDLFVVERTGRVQVVRDGEPLSTPFLDISDRITNSDTEQGLLSIAFDPHYQSDHRLYAYYTNGGGNIEIDEFRAASNTQAPESSRRTVIVVPHPGETNHNGGQLQFGPDGLLYAGTGDGGSEGDPNRTGQDLSTLLSKILRIDPRPSGKRPYSIPQSNPFVGHPGERPEIYSYGVRNPWRFSFDSATGALAIGDVGQDNWEEVDLVARGNGLGANFGWSAYEGFDRFNGDQQAPNAVPPVFVYSHDAGCSITGGYVVRDRTLPSLYGRYLYGDFCSGQLRSFTATPGRRATDDRALGLEVTSLSSFGTDAAGHIYATSLRGPVYRLVQGG
jgi:glucose/arabinose dehydrogenase